MRWLEAVDAAVGGGDADAAASVAAKGQGKETAGYGCGGGGGGTACAGRAESVSGVWGVMECLNWAKWLC